MIDVPNVPHLVGLVLAATFFGCSSETPPTHAAVSVAFTDLDPNGAQLEGAPSFAAALDESDVTEYRLYFGQDATTKLAGATPIRTLAVGAGTAFDAFAPDTPLPSGATHLLVYTANPDGEMAEGVSAAIIDVGVPVNAAVSVSFSDLDVDGGQIEGAPSFAAALDESDVTEYRLYFGRDATTKLAEATFIDTVAVGAGTTFDVFVTDTALPIGATHLLVYTANPDGEMASGVSVAIIDVGVPVNAAVSVSFSDLDVDGGQIEGAPTFAAALDERDVTEYRLYFGQDATTKLAGGTLIDTVLIGAGTAFTAFAPNTALPNGATHLLVFTANANGEMAAGVSAAIIDLGVPANAAVSVSFIDLDLDPDQLQGAATFAPALDESDVTEYRLYFGQDASIKLVGSAQIDSVAVGGGASFSALAADTPLPAGATHLLVFTANADGEMATGASVALVDAKPPLNAAVSVSFTDLDLDEGEIGGAPAFVRALDESDVTEYRLYFGQDATTKLAGSARIDTAAVGAGTLFAAFAANRAPPVGATHLLVFTANGDVEMAGGVSVAPVDLTGIVVASTDVPLAIPTDSTRTSTLMISGGPAVIADLRLTFASTLADRRFLELTLESPTGTLVALLEAVEASGAPDYPSITFSDAATLRFFGQIVSPTAGESYLPLQSLSAFDGETANGTWILHARIFGGLAPATLDAWSLTISE